MKTRIAVMFGGKSVEHEVSIISAIQAIAAMDTDKYEIIPVYLDKKNHMYIGEEIGNIEAYRDIEGLLKKSQHVILLQEETGAGLLPYPIKRFGTTHLVPFDLAFPIVHGTNVEDGTLQGYLKTLGIPFVGCDVTASAIGMDKYATKAILKDNDIPVLDGCCYTLADYANMDALLCDIEKKIGYPAIVKPLNLGSSVGITVAENRVKLSGAVDDAFLYARKIIVEHAITRLREINCAVLGDENEAIASECEEPLHSKDILTYEDKYLGGGKAGKSGFHNPVKGASGITGGKTGGNGTAGAGMASVSRKLPADLTPEQKARIQELAVRAFQKLGCNGVARIDFMMDEETDMLYFNEINTIPGSLSFYLWQPIGLSYPKLLDRMIELAKKRLREEGNLTFSFATNILNQQSLSGMKGNKQA